MIEKIVLLLGTLVSLLTNVNTNLQNLDHRLDVLERPKSQLILGAGGTINPISSGSSLLVGATLTSGTADRILYENSSNVLTESSVLTFDGTTLTSGAYLSTASSTFSRNLVVSGPLNASSTLNVGSILTATSTATTTVALQADSNAEGGCFQLRGSNGKNYRLYISAADAIYHATTTGSKSGIIAVWEAGAC